MATGSSGRWWFWLLEMGLFGTDCPHPILFQKEPSGPTIEILASRRRLFRNENQMFVTEEAADAAQGSRDKHSPVS